MFPNIDKISYSNKVESTIKTVDELYDFINENNHKNIQTIYFANNLERKGQVKLYKSVIKSSSIILSQKLISYMKKLEISIISHLIKF